MKKYPLLMNALSYFIPYRIEQRNGKMTQYLEVVLNNGKLVLNTSKVNYSYGSLHDLFLRTFQKINVKDRDIKNVLILGFGAGSIATLLTETFHKDCTITGIEGDEVVIELAKKHFNINRFKNLKIHNTDAYKFVMNCKDQFDLIAIDIFIDDYTPKWFSDDQFLSTLSMLLNPSGVICYNRIVTTPKSKSQAEELIKSFERNIGPNYLFQFRKAEVVNWIIIHDRTSLIITPDFEKSKSVKTFPLNLIETAPC